MSRLWLLLHGQRQLRPSRCFVVLTPLNAAVAVECCGVLHLRWLMFFVQRVGKEKSKSSSMILEATGPIWKSQLENSRRIVAEQGR